MLAQGAWRVARRSVAWLVIVSLLTVSCASRSVAPMGAGGKRFKPGVDELKLWAQAEKEEEQLQKKSKPYDDPLLDEYLAKIGDKLMPDDVREAGGPGFKFGVLRDPTLNAFAMPNGRVYIHTGLLARLDNEAQLAMIVGHEMTHVTNRHALSFTRDAQNQQIPFTVVAVAAPVRAAAAPGSRAGAVGYIGTPALGKTPPPLPGLGLHLAGLPPLQPHWPPPPRRAGRG